MLGVDILPLHLHEAHNLHTHIEVMIILTFVFSFKEVFCKFSCRSHVFHTKALCFIHTILYSLIYLFNL